jgi:hypothetical protein
MRSRVPWAIGSGLLMAAVAGCGRELAASARVEVPDRLTLYSVDGRDLDPGAKKPAAGEEFHGFPVLGKVVIEDPVRRKALIDAFNDGIARSDGTMAKCFWPRHGIRAEKGGMTVDYVICFECLQFATHRGDRHEGTAITRSPLARFDEELKRAGIPLAPSSFDKAR